MALRISTGCCFMQPALLPLPRPALSIIASSSVAASPHPHLSTLSEIFSAAHHRSVLLQLDAFGPFFKVTAHNSQNQVLGTAQGFVRVWLHGRILHLDSIRMSRLALEAEKPVFGMTLLLGAAAVRYGHDCNCTKAELLAINDTDVYHSKLIRYYTRMGFKIVYEVTGESLQDIPHMLLWGGVGTRMDADLRDLLLKWSPAIQRIAK